MKPHKISADLDNSLLLIQKCHLNVSLNELKFCKVSRTPKSNSCWKFQLSILTNKKVLFLKNICAISQEWTGFKIKTTSFVYRPNFLIRINRNKSSLTVTTFCDSSLQTKPWASNILFPGNIQIFKHQLMLLADLTMQSWTGSTVQEWVQLFFFWVHFPTPHSFDHMWNGIHNAYLPENKLIEFQECSIFETAFTILKPWNIWSTLYWNKTQAWSKLLLSIAKNPSNHYKYSIKEGVSSSKNNSTSLGCYKWWLQCL